MDSDLERFRKAELHPDHGFRCPHILNFDQAAS